MPSFHHSFSKITPFFQDKEGNIVIAQFPNPPLILAFLFYLLRLLPYPQAQTLSFWGTTICLSYWSYLEISTGASPWRRFLGTLVALTLVYQLLIQL